MGKKRSYMNDVVYPEERDGRAKDANKKLKSQVRSLKKTVKQQESEIKTLRRAYNKSLSIIEEMHSDKSLSEVIDIVNNSEYKETKKGQDKEKENKNLNLDRCPDCGKMEKKGFSIMKFKGFVRKMCDCGYNKRFDANEGIERS